MAKLVLNDVSSFGQPSAITTTAANNAAIETALENTLSRDGTSPNQMEANLDMNSNRIINLPVASTDTEPVRLAEFNDFIADLEIDGEITIADVEYAVRVNEDQNFTSSQMQQGLENIGLGSKFISVKGYGAVGDGVTNDYAAIVAARTAAVASGKTLIFPAGTYAIGSTLELGYRGLRVIAMGHVLIKHTGSGRAISFDNYDGVNATFDVQFGQGNPFYIQGNLATTDAIYVKFNHHARIAANVRDCVTGLRVSGSTLSKFEITCSANEEQFQILVPTNGLVITSDGSFSSEYHCIIEGVAGYGVDIQNTAGCTFFGTSESNAAGGIRIRSTATNNIFQMDNELNNANPDWTVEGTDNFFLDCTGALTTPSLNLTGDRNLFHSCNFVSTVTIGAAADRNRFEHTNFQSTFTDGGTNTKKIGCHNNGTPIADTAVLTAADLAASNVWTGSSVFSTSASQGAPVLVRSLNADALSGPVLQIDRNSASPAAGDDLGYIQFTGRNTTPAIKEFASIYVDAQTVTPAAEDGQIITQTMRGGTTAARTTVGAGLQVGAPTGGDKGAGTVNATNLLINGTQVGVIGVTITGVDFNSANTDTPVTIVLPSGFTRYRFQSIVLHGASASLTTATCGVFTDAAGAGTAIVASGTVISVSTASESTANNMQAFTVAGVSTTSWTDTAIFFRVQNPQGSAATGSVTFYYQPLA